MAISTHDVDYVKPGIEIVRNVEPQRPLMIVLEDFEDALRRGSEQSFDILALEPVVQ